MRTKVEKRRVRHDSGVAGQGSGGVNSTLPSVLSGSVLSTGGDKRDGSRDVSDRRPVSLSEAEKLAAANHVVVALGPPVMVGPHGVLDSRHDGSAVGVNLTTNATGSGGHHHVSHEAVTGSVVAAKAMEQETKKADGVPRPIKKPPKKRRNNEKKAEVVTDMVSNVMTAPPGQMPTTTELPLPPQPTMVLMPQLQQPPMTPPTPSPQQAVPLSPPQYGLTGQSPHHSVPLPLLPQQQAVSVVPEATADAVASPVASSTTDTSRTNGAIQHQVTGVENPEHLLHDDRLSVPEPVLQPLQPAFSQAYPDEQGGLVQPVADNYSAEGSLSASTSLLQPPTWLLTPQEIPMATDGVSGTEQLAACDQNSFNSDHSISYVSQPSHPVITSSSHSLSSQGLEQNSLTSGNSGPNDSSASKNKKKKSKSENSKAKAKSNVEGIEAQPAAPVEVNGEVGAGKIVEESETAGDASEAPPKSKKPPKKRPLPLPLDDNVERRIANIEATIDRVIAGIVYNCEDLSQLPGLRQAQRELEAKEAEEKAKLKEMQKTVKPSTQSRDQAASGPQEKKADAVVFDSQNPQLQNSGEAKSEEKPSSAPQLDGMGTQGSAVPLPVSEPQKSETVTTAATGTGSVKKPTAKKKQKKVETVTSGTENGPVEKPEEAVKTPPKKSKKKKKLEGMKSEENQNVTGVDAGQTDSSAEKAKETTGEAQPSPPKKKKKASKKKEVAAGEGEQQTESSQAPASSDTPSGHSQSTTIDSSPVTAKKKKPKSKGKKVTSDGAKPDGEGASEGSAVSGQTTEAAAAITPTGDGIAQSADGPSSTEKSSKPKPKKAKKRKSNVSEETDKGETKDNKEGEKSQEGDPSQPSPKKKKKGENSTESLEGKKKKSPSKSKKAKQTGEPSSCDGAVTTNSDSTLQQNGLPLSNEGSTETNTTESTPAEAGTTTETVAETSNDATTLADTSLEKKVKKTLDEVACKECGHKTRGQAALSRHMKKMHEKSISLPYPCPQQPCEYSASKVSLLARHMLTHRLYMCSRCQFTVDTKDQYEDHLQVVHNVKLDCKLCKKCNRYIKCDTTPLEKHLEVCQGPVPFTCDVCNKEFKYESSLKVHHHSHFPDQPKLFNCKQCDYSSNYRANLHKHVQNMHTERPRDIKCPTCEKMFSTEDNMRRHMKIHTQVRPFKCEKCDKAFKSACALKGHAVCHEMARPYQCNIENCNREFRTPKFLKSHQEEFHRLIPKKYHCPVEGCGFSFFKLSHLKRHEISHTGERNFHCEWPGCGKSFRHSDNLKVHLRQHTNERPISCPHCPFTCRQKSSLHWHVRKIHGPPSSTSSSPDASVTNTVSVSSVTSPQPQPQPLDAAQTLSEVAEVVVEGVSGESINIVIGEGGEVPVTITEIHPVDLYEFHSDDDSSDEATPGVFKRNRSKMANAAPLPPPPKELLMLNSERDVLDSENNQLITLDGKPKATKKKKATPKKNKSKQNTDGEEEKDGEKVSVKDGEKADNEAGTDDKDKTAEKEEKAERTPKKKGKAVSKKKEATTEAVPKKKAKAKKGEETAETTPKKKAKVEAKKKEEETNERTPEKKGKAEPKKKSTTTKSKKKKAEEKVAEEKEETEEKAEEPEEVEATSDGALLPAAATAAAGSKTPPRAKKAAAKKKAPPKKSPKETGTVSRKSPKAKAPAKGKTSPRTRSSPKKPSSPKGKPATPAVRKTPPRAAAKKTTRATAKKAPAKKTVAKKTTPVKKKAPAKKKAAAKKGKEKQKEAEPAEKDEVVEEEAEPVPQERGRSRKKSQSRAAKKKVEEEATSPARSESPAESEEENMPQGKGSPYREFDSQDVDESSPEPQESPSPPPSPTPVDQLQKSPAPEDGDDKDNNEEAAIGNAESQDYGEQPDNESSDGEVINDIPLTPPRAPAPPPPESSDEEEMVPSPPTHMPTSVDTSDTAAPSSVLTDQQPGSQAPDFQQPPSREEFPQPHSREEFQQPHSREEFQQPLSQQPMSREDYPQHHSMEEILQPHSREDYSQPLSREEYQQPLSVSQPHSREEYPQPMSREEYPQLHSREELHQQHSREELQPQGSVPEHVSEHVPSVPSESMHDDTSMPHSVVQYDPTSASPVPVSEAESAYQYLQGLAQSGETIPETLTDEPTRLQQLEALTDKTLEDSRTSVKSPAAVPTSVIANMSPAATNAMGLGPPDVSSHRRMEILSSDRQVEQPLGRDTASVLPRLPDPAAYDAYSALNPLAAGAARDNSALFPAPPATPGFMRLTESEALLQRQRMTTPFLTTPQPPERSLSRLPESSLRPPNPSTLLRQSATMPGADMFPGAPGMPQAMPRNPFTNSWAGQDVRPAHWSQTATYLQRPPNAATPFPFATKDNYLAGREFMFDPTRPGVADRNMFASLSSSQASASDTNPFPLDRFDLSTYFGSHAYSGASGLDYSRAACGAAPKTFDERYRQTAASMTDFRPLPPTTSTDMFSGIGVGVNSLNSASFNLDKYAMYGRDSMYAAAQQLSENTNSAFLTHAAQTQSMFDRDYAARSLYTQNPAYPFINERQYTTAAKLTGHPPTATMGQERDFMARATTSENQIQDPYRGVLYNVMNRYTFE